MTVDSASPTTRPYVGVRARMRPSRHVVGVGVLTALMAAGYSVFSLVLNYTFHTSSYDLVIFDEAVRSYAHFEPGISVIKGLHNNFGPDFSVLGDHWSPILASLAPCTGSLKSLQCLRGDRPRVRRRRRRRTAGLVGDTR